jgi:hypothetical protein
MGGQDVIARDIVITGKQFTVVGVTPQSFFGEQVGFSLDISYQ